MMPFDIFTLSYLNLGASTLTLFSSAASVHFCHFTNLLMLLLDFFKFFFMFFQVCEQCPNVKYEREGYFVTVDIEKGMQDGHVWFLHLYYNHSIFEFTK